MVIGRESPQGELDGSALVLGWEGADPCSTRLPCSPCRAWEGAVGGGGFHGVDPP